MAARICILEVPGLNLVSGIPTALLYEFSRFSPSVQMAG